MAINEQPSGVIAKVPPSRLYRWLVLLSTSIAVFGSYYGFDSIGPLAAVLSRQLRFSDSDIGVLQAIYSFPNIVMVLVSGVVIDRVGTKRATLLFGAMCFAGLAVTAVTPRLSIMAAGRLLFGVGAESLAIAVTTVAARWFRGKELSFAFGVQGTIERLGSLAAQVSPIWAVAAYAYWQGPLLIAAAIGTLCVTGAVLYWILESRAEHRYELAGAQRHGRGVPMRSVFSFNRSFWLLVALCVTFYAGIFPFQTFAQKLFVDARHVTPQTASLLVGMLTFLTMVGTPLFGLLVDRVGRRALVMLCGTALVVPVYLMMAYTAVPLVVPMAMMGVAFSIIPAVIWPSVAYVIDESRLGTAYGVMDAIQQAGLVGFNLIIGWSNDHWAASAAHPSGYRPGMWMFTIIALLAMGSAVLLRRVETGPRSHGLETITIRSGR